MLEGVILGEAMRLSPKISGCNNPSNIFHQLLLSKATHSSAGSSGGGHHRPDLDSILRDENPSFMLRRSRVRSGDCSDARPISASFIPLPYFLNLFQASSIANLTPKRTPSQADGPSSSMTSPSNPVMLRTIESGRNNTDDVFLPTLPETEVAGATAVGAGGLTEQVEKQRVGAQRSVIMHCEVYHEVQPAF